METEDWFRNAVVYAVDVELFADGDGDGVGDFEGFTEALEHVDRLGASAVWVLPFYPTPNRDNGYDVRDYYGVDPRLGSLGDFVEFVEEAEDRGIRVLIDLVVNHTSDRHPWFRAARSDPDSKYRDYYVWTDDPPPSEEQPGSVFPGEVEDERVWTYDDEAEAYYYHRFYPFQPELNLRNPAVREEIGKIATFWLKLGVSGFRVDAATLMIQPKHPDDDPATDPYDLFRRLKRVVTDHREDAVLLGEADDEPHRLNSYFAGGEAMDLLMNFQLNAHLVAALATERSAPLVEGLDRVRYSPSGTWANFLRNYDELNLSSLEGSVQETVFERFAPSEGMRIYGRGIRRRLAPMLEGDPRRLRNAYSLLFSLPGSPILLYGDEIGMGEDLSLPGRQAVRTPMQWDDGPNAGFSPADTDDLVVDVIDEGPFGYGTVNVAAQRGDPDSLFEWMRRLVTARHDAPEIGDNPCEVVETSERGVFVHRYVGAERTMGFAHNLTDRSVSVSVALGWDAADRLRTVFGEADVESLDEGRHGLGLDPYGYAWFEVERRTEADADGGGE